MTFSLPNRCCIHHPQRTIRHGCSPSLSVYLCPFYHDSLVSLSTKFTSMYCGNLMGKLLKHIKTGRVVRSRCSVRKREEVTINFKAWHRSLLSLCFNYLWSGNAVILHGTFIHMNKKNTKHLWQSCQPVPTQTRLWRKELGTLAFRGINYERLLTPVQKNHVEWGCFLSIVMIIDYTKDVPRKKL